VRTYGQACPVAHALDLIGERWALLVARELRLGPRRYAELQAALPRIGPSVLADRLRDLQRAGVVERRDRQYALTAWGADLEPVFTALAAWGGRSPVVPLAGEVSEDAVVLGLRTSFRPGEPDWSATYAIRLERDAYTARIDAGRLADLRRGAPATADATVTTDRHTLLALVGGGPAEPSRVKVRGDARAARRLFDAWRD
jgi:DNA-binding HxlR family transcriptional regulator